MLYHSPSGASSLDHHLSDMPFLDDAGEDFADRWPGGGDCRTYREALDSLVEAVTGLDADEVAALLAEWWEACKWIISLAMQEPGRV